MQIILLLVAITLIFVFICILFLLIAKRQNNKKTEIDVLSFLKENPSKASLYMIKNGMEKISYNSEVKMPLASTAKVIIAIEFARQVAAKLLDEHELVDLEELNKFYIPGSDGNAHNSWIKWIKSNHKEVQGKITLFEIAHGMLAYSSNANTEFLMDKMGLDEINENINKLSLSLHDKIFPFSSAGLMSSYIQEVDKIGFKESIQKISEMTYKEYMEKSIEIHQILNSDKGLGCIQKWNTKQNYARRLQVLESRKLPRSTTKEYAYLMKLIHKEELVPSTLNPYLKMLIQRQVDNSKLIEFGNKGGSTISVLTEALYCTDREGNDIQLAMFIQDDSGVDHIWLKQKLDLFFHKLLTDTEFQKEVSKKLSYDKGRN
ncbi:beta-lactamase [Paenibacillus jamilae]|uniref:Beta-lactamase n=3 Tax=Paenibacillus TaxID=44249 RepID=E3E9T5_PAEPS|nr:MULTISPECIES: serine hydrolase [Paenibacillus]KAF6568659.1 serine hydrolase [Paenibacillus sp. EKM207P]ADO57875.1 beta-lactamase [Paenibacillus polymyxa SC2]AJE52955.1 beta-lactamase [Paenibacillus polymyxa]AUO07768.1 serine hydrolase [Paenibacillus sp. lzh-N1]KAF6563638.1 serine hydrolase [Paenibacillus sp. EKM202P]